MGFILLSCQSVASCVESGAFAVADCHVGCLKMTDVADTVCPPSSGIKLLLDQRTDIALEITRFL
jgi:hypothetical protein